MQLLTRRFISIDLKLPPKSEYVHKITFHTEEKKKYEALL